MVAAFALTAPRAAQADTVETFNLSGAFGSFFGSPVAYTGAINLDFSNDFSSYTVTSITITVLGRPSAFNQNVSLSLRPSAGVVGAYNSDGDQLALWFAAPQSGTWAGFDSGGVSFGDVVFSGLTGGLFGATGEVTRSPFDLPITDPPDPPTPAAVPELSTWAMMLIGLASLGLAAKGRRALGALRERA